MKSQTLLIFFFDHQMQMHLDLKLTTEKQLELLKTKILNMHSPHSVIHEQIEF